MHWGTVFATLGAMSNSSSRSVLVTRSESGEISTQLVAADASHVNDGDVLIDVAFSSLNFKDGMALEGNRGVARTFPLVPGIDAVGVVVESASDRFAVGDKVVANGEGLGEFRHGGYTARQRLHSEATVALPAAFSMRQAAAIGTAGYTAALCVNALIKHGVKPEDGPILVTGATGGVGSIAVHLLAQRGYSIVASTGRVEEHGNYLRALGAGEVIDRATLSEKSKPLQKAVYAGVVDCVGSHTLVNACAQTMWGGIVTACGLAQGPDLPGTVLPFILRGVSLVGVDSVNAPLALREEAWALLAETIDVSVLESLTTTVGLDGVIEAGAQLLRNERHGRTVVVVNPDAE